MLVVVEYGDVEQLLELLLDDEAVGRLDILEIDTAERRCQVADAVDERIDVLGIDQEIHGIDVGEPLEQRALAFHHRLGGERAEVAQPEDGGAVRHDRDEVALVGVVVDAGRVFGDRVDGDGHARRVCERQVALRRERLRRGDFQLAGLALGVELERFLLRETGLRSLGASGACHARWRVWVFEDGAT